MRTLEFVNTTENILDEGPISVFKDDIFQGEAVLPVMLIGEKQRIPYAINQSIEVNAKTGIVSENIHEIKLISNARAYYFQVNKSTYNINNISEESQELVLEHPKKYNFKLFETDEPEEQTKNFYRYRIALDPSESKEITIFERNLLFYSYNYESVNRDMLESWKKLELIQKEEYEKLLKIVELSEKVAEMNKQISNLKERRSQISQEQARIRENLKVLKKSNSEKKLRERYISKFEDGEKELDEIETIIENLVESIKRITNKNEEQVEHYRK